MKKYITPSAKFINIASEGHLLQGSNDPEDEVFNEKTTAPSLSNRRNIWGEEY